MRVSIILSWNAKSLERQVDHNFRADIIDTLRRGKQKRPTKLRKHAALHERFPEGHFPLQVELLQLGAINNEYLGQVLLCF